MKKLLLACGVVGIYFMSTAASCKDEITAEPESKNYNCKCTYIARDSSNTDKEEMEVVSAQSEGSANVRCKQLESKYPIADYQGTCLLQ